MPREQYELRWKDYYQILGVRPDADLDAIRRMWRRLSQVYHPDVAGSAAVDPERMQELNEAWRSLLMRPYGQEVGEMIIPRDSGATPETRKGLTPYLRH